MVCFPGNHTHLEPKVFLLMTILNGFPDSSLSAGFVAYTDARFTDRRVLINGGLRCLPSGAWYLASPQAVCVQARLCPSGPRNCCPLAAPNPASVWYSTLPRSSLLSKVGSQKLPRREAHCPLASYGFVCLLSHFYLLISGEAQFAEERTLESERRGLIPTFGSVPRAERPARPDRSHTRSFLRGLSQVTCSWAAAAEKLARREQGLNHLLASDRGPASNCRTERGRD